MAILKVTLARDGKQQIAVFRADAFFSNLRGVAPTQRIKWGSGKMWDVVAVDDGGLYACEACAREMQYGGIEDAEGYLVPSGRTESFWAACSLCEAPAAYNVTHQPPARQEVR